MAEYIKTNEATILEQRYKALTPTLVNVKTTTDLKWAPPVEVKREVDAQLAALLGPKDERDAPPKKQPKAVIESRQKLKDGKKEEEEEVNKNKMFEEGFLAGLHKPGGNKQILAKNMEAHLEATGGKVFTRFPPEVCLSCEPFQSL